MRLRNFLRTLALCKIYKLRGSLNIYTYCACCFMLNLIIDVIYENQPYNQITTINLKTEHP